jgi:pimeloyl-ACP methyl ester carboxylesterase
MFFNESEQLLRRHPSLSSLITQIDARLSQFDGFGLAKPSDFATFLNAKHDQVVALFDELVASGVLIATDMCECTKCNMLTPTSDYRACIASGEELLCPTCGTDLIKDESRQIKVFRLSSRALHETTKNKMTPKHEVDHVIPLIHGILTDAVWQERVAAELNLLPKVEASPIGYGILELVMFWCPLFTRRIALRTIEKKIRHAIARHPGAKISVIAHSFGTYATFRLLNENADLRFHRVVLCGSIVSDRYPWDHVEPRVENTIINDCGTRDRWPAIAKTLTWGYGATGTFGFKSPGIRDRFHDFDHSGFFTDEFVQTYWMPFISTGEIVPSPWTSKRASSPFLVKCLAAIPLQWITLLLLLYLFKLNILRLLYAGLAWLSGE